MEQHNCIHTFKLLQLFYLSSKPKEMKCSFKNMKQLKQDKPGSKHGSKTVSKEFPKNWCASMRSCKNVYNRQKCLKENKTGLRPVARLRARTGC
jgi:hypothetical protein